MDREVQEKYDEDEAFLRKIVDAFQDVIRFTANTKNTKKISIYRRILSQEIPDFCYRIPKSIA